MLMPPPPLFSASLRYSLRQIATTVSVEIPRNESGIDLSVVLERS